MPDPIVYVSPKMFTTNAVLSRVETLALVGVLGFLLIRGGNSMTVSILLGVTIASAFLFRFRGARPHLMRRIELYEDGFWIGGLDRGHNVKYDDVALIQSFPSISYAELVIGDRSGNTVALPLRKKDAGECLQQLHELCGAAASIDAGNRALVPENPAKAAAGQALLAAVFRQRAKHARIACILGIVVWIAALAVALSNSPNWPATRTTWGFVIALPLLVTIGLVTWRRSLSRASELDHDLDIGRNHAREHSEQVG